MRLERPLRGLALLSAGFLLIAATSDSFISSSFLPAGSMEVKKDFRNWWIAEQYPYQERMRDYDPAGPYLAGPLSHLCEASPNYRDIDDRGVVVYIKDGGHFYHPTMVIECGLYALAAKLQGQDVGSTLEQYAERVLTLIDNSGHIKIPFSFYYYVSGGTFDPGWLSALSQGEALSFLSRAYRMTGDERFVSAGNKIVTIMGLLITEGGVAHTTDNVGLANHIFFEEYPSLPAAHTLNGHMSALLGLYDWSLLGHGGARTLFDRGLDTLARLLPLYDLGGISAYDLGYITHRTKVRATAAYHGLHIVQLNALASVTRRPELIAYRDIWLKSVREIDSQHRLSLGGADRLRD